MYLIVGLGNPENEYKGTRHNVGFEAINKLAYDHNIPLNKSKFRGEFGKGIISGKNVILLKPQTYMNLSGEAVIDFKQYFKINVSDIIVVYDDVDLPLGRIRIRERGSAGTHNGMKNIVYHLNSDEFLRVRVGIGQKPPGYELADYVLSRFHESERDDFVNGVTLATDALESILKHGPETAMNKFNPKA